MKIITLIKDKKHYIITGSGIVMAMVGAIVCAGYLQCYNSTSPSIENAIVVVKQHEYIDNMEQSITSRQSNKALDKSVMLSNGLSSKEVVDDVIEQTQIDGATMATLQLAKILLKGVLILIAWRIAVYIICRNY